MDSRVKIEIPVPLPEYYSQQEHFLHQQVHAPIVISVMLSFIAIFSSLFLAIQSQNPSDAYAAYDYAPAQVQLTPSPIKIQVQTEDSQPSPAYEYIPQDQSPAR